MCSAIFVSTCVRVCAQRLNSAESGRLRRLLSSGVLLLLMRDASCFVRRVRCLCVRSPGVRLYAVLYSKESKKEKEKETKEKKTAKV